MQVYELAFILSLRKVNLSSTLKKSDLEKLITIITEQELASLKWWKEAATSLYNLNPKLISLKN